MRNDAPRSRLAGIDGCRAGWIACLVDGDGGLDPEIRVVARLAEVMDGPDAPEFAAIDMPIGLPEHCGPGGRGPERLVRPRLGERQSSVFSIPSRAAVYAGEGLDERAAYAAVCRAALATSDPPRKVSKQAFNLFPKIREVDRWMADGGAGRLYESHPELALACLNNWSAMVLPKKVKSLPNPAGLDERRALLARHGFEPRVLARPPRGAGPDDLIDACVLALVARRIRRGEAVSFPDPPARDGRGLPVAIWA
ncbi:MAG: DUF429 domain-containing protein [Ancalomicrobiaceae bacterium]|nr:DUF429 domain-containing protein [Ancalomicrobiaceae bacterium]